DGLYAISASVTDNFGSTSLPVAGGSYNQNNILLRVDGTPPEISIQWPPPGYTSTVSRLPANAFAGSASDRSGQPVVRGTIRRVSDGAYWSNYGWIYMREQAMFTASYPGGDGGSFSEWKLDPELPGAGFNTAWCMPNGDYELIVVATDAIGNTNEVTRAFTVQYESPLFAGLPATDFSPAQDPLNTNAFAMVAVTAVPPFSVAAEQPEGYHGLFAAANGSYRVLAGTLQLIGFGYSSRDPVLYAADSTGNLAVTPVTNTIEYAENYFYERNAGTPVADFRADGAGVTASTLLERDYGYGGTYRFVTKSEITRFDGTGNILWQVLTPPTNYTGWAGYASGPAGLNVKWMKLLDDDRVVVVAEFYGYRNSTYSNYRHHVLCLILNAGGQVVSANRFGVETEDEYRQENEFFIDAAVDGAGNVFVATRGNTGGQPSHYLRKIRLSDGALSGEYAMDTCTSPEWWSAIEVDAAGWVFVGGAVDTGDGQPRLLVTRLDPVDLTRDWRAYGPANSGGPSVAQGVPVRMPLLRSLNGSVYVVHDHDGSNIYDVNDDRIYATRFDPSGQLMWCREIDHLDGSYTRGNQAGYGVLTPAGDILFTGEFDLSSFPYKQGYVKIAANGDLQFARSIGLTNVVARSVTSDRQRIALALGGPGQLLAVVELDNPANMHPAQGSTYAQWVYEQSLNGAGALPDAMPTGDGVANLMRYASNLGAWEPAATLVPGAGTRGLPDMRTSGTGGVLRLRVEYLRRLNDSNLIYQVQFAPDLRSQGLWENAISSATRTAIDADWERVVVEDHVAGANATSRFSRVKVQLLQP
ncbi:MAG: hypothetical protein ACO398_09490, partial [Kiritimatiellia bacterium]